jgi:hypothetical protein
VELEESGAIRLGGYAPYLDYRPVTEAERAALAGQLQAEWLAGESLAAQAVTHAVEELAPRHLERVRRRREKLIDKTLAAVQERLTREINYWDGRAAELRRQEREGRLNARLNSKLAQQRADELADRLAKRKEELARERQLSAAMPVVIGGALVVPMGLLLEVSGQPTPPELTDRRITEAMAMQAVMEAEIALGNQPKDVSQDNLGYDIESLEPQTGRLRFIEVKGRRAGADTVTVTRNEILTGINAEDQYILALVEVADGQARPPRYVRRPFQREPDFGVTSVNYDVAGLLQQGQQPA